MSTGKTHFRKVYKSDYLGIADLEEYRDQGHNLVFNISHVRQEYGTKVAGKSIDANIAYFAEGIKPLVLNSTNAKTVKLFANSSYIEDWVNIPVQLYIDYNVAMRGETVGGVRINPNRPTAKKMLTPDNKSAWKRAVIAFKRDGNLNKVLESIDISQEHQDLIISQANA